MATVTPLAPNIDACKEDLSCYRDDLLLLPAPTGFSAYLEIPDDLSGDRTVASATLNFARYTGFALLQGLKQQQAAEPDPAPKRSFFRGLGRKNSTAHEISIQPNPDFQTPIVQAAHDALSLPGLSITTSSDLCAEVEPRLIRSVEKAERNEDTRRAGVILARGSDLVGYVKSSGLELGYVFEDTESEAGSVPGDSITTVEYSDDARARLDEHGSKGTAVIDIEEAPVGLHWVRFSGHMLPISLRTALAYDVTQGKNPKLAENLDGAIGLSPDSFRDRVERLVP